MRIETITLSIPKTFKDTHKKLEAVFPISMVKSKLMPVIQKRFPMDFIQAWVTPFENRKYQYLICLKPMGRIPLAFSVIHESNCLIQLFRDDNGEVTANLHVQLHI